MVFLMSKENENNLQLKHRKEEKKMARKMMTKEVTKTTVKLAIMEIVDGTPQAKVLPDEVLIGNVSQEKAKKELDKKIGKPVTVFEVKPETEVYEMEVEKFVQLAELKVAEEPEATLV